MLPALGTAATLALVNLSMVLGTGVLAATPLGQTALAEGVVAAFLAATLGGFAVAVLARADAEMAAPAASTTVIYAALAADLVSRAGAQASFPEVWAALSLAVVIMGVLLALAGWLRIAEAIKFMPAPVGAGFVTGIGLLLIWAQIGPLLGVEGRIWRYDFSELAWKLKPLSLGVGLTSAAVMIGLAKLAPRAQPALVAVVAGTVLHHVVVWLAGPAHAGPTLGTIEPVQIAKDTFGGAWSGVSVPWVLDTSVLVLPYAAFLALQATMNAAVVSVAVGNITGKRSNVSRMLKVQGVTNLACGLMGALPVTTAASQSLPAARMGTNWKIIAGSCSVLFLGVLTAGGLLSVIPVAALAGILIVTGLNMIDRWARGLASGAWREHRLNAHVAWNIAIVAAVAAAFFFGSVPLALIVGAVLAMVLLAVNVSAATLFVREDGASFASTRVWPAVEAQWLAAERSRIALFRPRGALFFGTADQLVAHLDNLEDGIRYCAVDLSRLTTLDATGCQILAASARRLGARGVTTVLAGIIGTSPRARELAALGLAFPEPQRWFADLDHALEWIEDELLRARWPERPTEAPVDLAATPLAAGLSATELAELESCLTAVDAAPGVLFRRGEPAASMFVIDRGRVEVRIGGAAPGQPVTRLAAFGPGAIFGELTLLTAGARTADAVCVEPTRLYELRRDVFAALAQRSPALYARIVENLGRHLANRLVVATAIVQAHR